MYHVPVLLNQSIDPLIHDRDGVYVDVTFGGGGHSREILARLSPRGRLIAFDQDSDALANAPRDPRFTLINNNFRFMRGCLRALGVDKVDGVLADLGVSSHHFDTAQRGFSFRYDAPLDMRMNQSAPLSALDVVNTYSAERLASIFGRYGELDKCFRIAGAIIRAREALSTTDPQETSSGFGGSSNSSGSGGSGGYGGYGGYGLRTIGSLLEAVDCCTPRGAESKFRAKLFQAIRIEVNGEMKALEMMLSQSLSMLRHERGGVLSVITYHSLEDRIVKNFMRAGNFEGRIEKDFYGRNLSPFELINRKVIEPSAEEIAVNSRARSAKLRVARVVSE